MSGGAVRVERTLDSGPLVDMAVLDIDPLESAGELEGRLAKLAADLLESNLASFADGTFTETPQNHDGATMAPKLDKGAGLMDWSADADRVFATVRAYTPWPGAFSFLHRAGKPPERTVFVKVRPVEAEGDEAKREKRSGLIEAVSKKRLRVHCGRGSVEVERIQRAGKAAMAAAAYLRGQRFEPGDFFGPPGTREIATD